MSSAEARQQAQAEGLTLRVADNTTGYLCVYLANPGQSRPYQAKVWRGGKTVHLGTFVTAEEAALCVARSPEGKASAAEAAAAERAAAAMTPAQREQVVKRKAADASSALARRKRAKEAKLLSQMPSAAP